MRPQTLLLCILVSLPAASLAHGHGRAPPQRLDQILPGFRQSHPGTFYDAQGPYRGQDGHLHYRLKWLTPQGHMVWYDTEARSGAVRGRVHGPRPEPPGPREYHPREGHHDRGPQNRHHR
ncbi:MAG: hypothetical protein KGO02_23775 [Alphaproteobacteria bacterium]|nr:hypothetical protein [Alphaproteobacteria bacterium]